MQVIEEIAAVLGIRAARLFEEEAVPQNIIAADRDRFVADVTEALYQRLTADMKGTLERLV